MNVAYQSNEIKKLCEYVGEGVYEWQKGSRHLCVPLENNAFLFVFNWCDVADMSKKEERVVIFCSGQELLLFSNSLKLPEGDKGGLAPGPFQMLALFLDMLTAGDVDTLDQLEDTLSVLEEDLITATKLKKGTGAEIVIFRRSLLKLKRYYEQLSAVADALALNESGAVPKTLTNRFLALRHRIDHLEATVAHLREYVTQVREAYQAQIDIEQNQIMKIFTVLTAVFLPLSLIVGWYGMNFHMPEYEWRFGYLYVFVFSVAVCGLTYWIFKRKKWF